MAGSPFEFFRGAAAVMAADLGPRATCGLEVQLCGDAHLLNLGAYAGEGGRLVFDLDDFDETCHGPLEWDLKRLAVSFVVGGREAGHDDATCRHAVVSFVSAYRECLERCSRLSALDLARIEISPSVAAESLAPIFTKAARETPARLLEKVTIHAAGGLARFRSAPPMQVRLRPDAARAVLAALPTYRAALGPDRLQLFERYTPRDTAFHAAGIGSLGVDEYLILLYGNGAADPLFLQVKEQRASCWRPYLSAARAEDRSPNQGRRAMEGQLRVQTVADPLLGWTRIRAKDFLVRQWSDHKAALDVTALRKRAVLLDFAALCGRVLGKSHARTGDAAMISGYCGSSDRLDSAIAAFAVSYADQTELDHEHFRRSFAGRRARLNRPVRG
jgi:uncharacterized protein (DUF2252 family)